MPSSPMLTTPARSDQSPPRPARPMGTAAASAAPTAPPEVRSSAPVNTRTADEHDRPMAIRMRTRALTSRRGFAGPRGTRAAD